MVAGLSDRRSRASSLSCAALAVGILATLPATALAQERGSKLEAEKEAPPKLEPVGASFGAFRAYVGGDAGVVYDDNVYALTTGKSHDTYFKIAPKARITSDTSRYKFNASAGVDRYQYAKLKSENRTDVTVKSDVIAEFMRDTSVTFSAGYRSTHEERGAPDSPVTAKSPVRYESLTAGGGLAREVGRLQARAIVDYEKLSFKNGQQGNGTTINNKDRDREYVAGGGELSYEFSPGYRIYTRALLDNVSYRLRFDDSGFNRNGHGYRVTGGVKFDLTNVIAGSVFAGYMHRKYTDVRFPDYGGAAYGANLRWNPTRLTTIVVDANRGIQETTQIGYRGYISTDFGVHIQHDLTRFVQLDAGARYSKNKYLLATAVAPVPLDRSDDIYMANFGVTYIFSRQISLAAGWDYTKRSSNAPATDYTRNKASATLKLTF
jgi:hypothetical protein